jgi:hypothetical protein
MVQSGISSSTRFHPACRSLLPRVLGKQIRNNFRDKRRLAIRVLLLVLPPSLDIVGVPAFWQDGGDVVSFVVVHDAAIVACDDKGPNADSVRPLLDEVRARIVIANPSDGFSMKLIGEGDVLPSPKSLQCMNPLRLGF